MVYCAICYDPEKEDDKFVVTCCNHTFHIKCLRLWITHGKEKEFTCPLCRRFMDGTPYIRN